jgi:hypothetical protein
MEAVNSGCIDARGLSTMMGMGVDEPFFDHHVQMNKPVLGSAIQRSQEGMMIFPFRFKMCV